MSDFDRELTLRELLPADEATRLVVSLATLLETGVALLDERGEHLAGELGLDAGNGAEIVLEIDPVGHLAAPGASSVARAAAANLVRQMLVARARYLRAADLHQATTQADYEALQHQNAALRSSEAKFRALSEELEARVAAQVKVIDERQRQLYQAERLASVGQLAAGVAHEINNPIGFVRSNLGTARKYLEKLLLLGERVRQLPGGEKLWTDHDMAYTLEDFSDLLRDSIGGVDRVARIVADLKGFSSVDKPEEEITDINGLLTTVCNMAEQKLPAGARLIRALDDGKPILCLPGHLSQAFMAVIGNALLAIEDRAPPGEVSVASTYRNGNMVVTVRDNGTGIAGQDLARVFDPFFTTRPVGQGTGLGLTVARDILRVHGGEIEIDSTPGVGTVVTMTVPE